MSDEQATERDDEESEQKTFGVKASLKTRNLVGEMAKKKGQHLNQFFEEMVIRESLSTMNDTSIQHTEDMEQLKYHLKRTEDIFANLIKKNNDIRSDFTTRTTEESSLLKQKNAEMQEQKFFTDQALKVAIEAKNVSILEQDELNKEMIRINKLLVEATNREKTDRLAIELLSTKNNELQNDVTEMPHLRNEKAVLEQQLNALQLEISKMNELFEALNTRIADITLENEKATERAKESACKDIEQLRHVNELLLSKATTEADRRVLEAINSEREQCTLKINSYISKVEALTQRNDDISTRNQSLVNSIHAMELKQSPTQK